MEIFIVLGMFGALIIGLASGHPLAWVLGGVGVLFGVSGWGMQAANIFVMAIFGVMNNYTLIAIPLFVLMANFLMRSEIAEGLFEAARYLFGPIRGGLGIAVILVSTVFAATTGIVGASVISMGLLGLPVLMKYKYNKGLSAGVICAGGSLGILIPPSIMLVVMASQTELSVGKLFMAAVVPGLVLSLCYIIYICIVCWRHPEYGPALTAEEAAAMPMKARLKMAAVNLIPPLILILGVLGTIFGGIATPTEAAAMGATLSFLLTIFYRKCTLKMITEAVIDTTKTTAMCFAILIGANAFTAIFLGMDGANIVADILTGIGIGKWGSFILMQVIVFLLGMFIDWIGIVLIVFPIFIPLLESFGFDTLFVVTVTAVMLQTCFLTPPFGYALFYLKGIAPPELTTMDIYKGIIPFVLIIIFVVVLITVFPDIAMYWPNHVSL